MLPPFMTSLTVSLVQECYATLQNEKESGQKIQSLEEARQRDVKNFHSPLQSALRLLIQLSILFQSKIKSLLKETLYIGVILCSTVFTLYQHSPIFLPIRLLPWLGGITCFIIRILTLPVSICHPELVAAQLFGIVLSLQKSLPVL